MPDVPSWYDRPDEAHGGLLWTKHALMRFRQRTGLPPSDLHLRLINARVLRREAKVLAPQVVTTKHCRRAIVLVLDPTHEVVLTVLQPEAASRPKYRHQEPEPQWPPEWTEDNEAP